MSSKLRSYFVPILGFAGLALMFLKLPEVESQLIPFKCKLCFSNSDPYIPLLGGGYFSFLTSAALLFPSFPGIYLARGGFISSIALAFGLTYISLPNYCLLCLFAHGCNIAIWTTWLTTPVNDASKKVTHYRERICMMFLGTISAVSLLGSMNLTFLIYGLKQTQTLVASGLETGDSIPLFIANTSEGKSISNEQFAGSKRTLINFVSPNCPYCKEQLAFLKKLEGAIGNIIVISPLLEKQLESSLPMADWIEDTDEDLRKRFKVKGYPTLFIVGNDGVIKKVIAGVPNESEL